MAKPTYEQAWYGSGGNMTPEKYNATYGGGSSISSSSSNSSKPSNSPSSSGGSGGGILYNYSGNNAPSSTAPTYGGYKTPDEYAAAIKRVIASGGKFQNPVAAGEFMSKNPQYGWSNGSATGSATTTQPIQSVQPPPKTVTAQISPAPVVQPKIYQKHIDWFKTPGAYANEIMRLDQIGQPYYDTAAANAFKTDYPQLFKQPSVSIQSQPTWQQNLESYKTNRQAGSDEIARAGEVYNQKKAAGDLAGADAAHTWANQIRQAIGEPQQFSNPLQPTQTVPVPAQPTLLPAAQPSVKPYQQYIDIYGNPEGYAKVIQRVINSGQPFSDPAAAAAFRKDYPQLFNQATAPVTPSTTEQAKNNVPGWWLPVRSFLEGLGQNVTWDPTLKTIGSSGKFGNFTINSNQYQEQNGTSYMDPAVMAGYFLGQQPKQLTPETYNQYTSAAEKYYAPQREARVNALKQVLEERRNAARQGAIARGTYTSPTYDEGLIQQVEKPYAQDVTNLESTLSQNINTMAMDEFNKQRTAEQELTNKIVNYLLGMSNTGRDDEWKRIVQSMALSDKMLTA